jgi:hypothetical protein
MDGLELASDEVVLYTGSISKYSSVWRDARRYALLDAVKQRVVLTNRRLAFEMEIHKLVGAPVYEYESFDLASLKTYDDRPYVKATGLVLDVYAEDETVSITFNGKLALMKFRRELDSAATGVAASTRRAQKVRSAVGTVDDALGIDTMGTVRDVVTGSIVGTVAQGVGALIGSAVAGAVGTERVQEAFDDGKGFVKSALGFGRNGKAVAEEPVQPEPSFDEKVEAVKKLKELLDMGVLTQTEFDMKKAELLGL